MEKSKFDSIFKRIVKDVFFKMLNTELNSETTEYEDITSQPIELPKTLDRKADFVFLVTENEVKSVFHLEIQTEDDKNMPIRMLTYLALLNEVYNKQEKGETDKIFLRIRQVVLYLGNLERDKKLQSKMICERDFGDTIQKYKIINISQISYEEFLKDKETLVFAILGNFNSLDAVCVIDKIVELSLKFFENITDRNEFLIDLVTLAYLRGLTAVVKENLKQNPKIMANNIDFTQSILFQEGKEEGIIEGKEEGIIEGGLKKNLENAKTMLERGYNISQVQDITALSFEQIQKLQEEINTES